MQAGFLWLDASWNVPVLHVVHDCWASAVSTEMYSPALHVGCAEHDVLAFLPVLNWPAAQALQLYLPPLESHVPARKVPLEHTALAQSLHLNALVVPAHCPVRNWFVPQLVLEHVLHLNVLAVPLHPPVRYSPAPHAFDSEPGTVHFLHWSVFFVPAQLPVR